MSDTPSTPRDQGIRSRTPSAPERPERREPQEDTEARDRQERFLANMNRVDDDDRRDRTTGKLPTRSTGGPALSQESLRF